MSSTNKTANIALNQWEATDAPLRADFNADNQRIDAAFAEDRQTLGQLAGALEDASHNIYSLYMRQYYDGKDVPHRATLFFDGFANVSMTDEAASIAYTDPVQRCLCNWDKRFVRASQDLYPEGSETVLGRYGSFHNTAIAQSFSADGPFRLLQVRHARRSSVAGERVMNLAAYTTDAAGLPTGKTQNLAAITVSTLQNGFGFQSYTHTFAQPVPLPSGLFAIGFDTEALGVSQSEYVLFPTQPPISGTRGVYVNTGSWRPAISGGYPLAMDLYGCQLSMPPRYVSRDVVLNRACRQATVYMTQNTASAGHVVPKIALYNAGETPEYLPMTRDSARDVSLTGGQLETCHMLTLPQGKTRAKLMIQFDGLDLNTRVYEYGCILSD